MMHKSWLVKIILWLAAAVGAALVTGWSANQFNSLHGWEIFILPLILAGALLWGGWRLIGRESPPAWLGYLLIVAALVRLGVGILWYSGLPRWGYDSPAEQGGYVMADAYQRDQAAWELSQSGKPLLAAYRGAYRRADQYGGLLLLSAGIYRFLGGTEHRPLQIIVLTAVFGALSVGFTWGFTQRAFSRSNALGSGGKRADPALKNLALYSALGLAFYPEAILLSSSHMREAFTMTFTMLAFWGLLRYLDAGQRQDLVVVAAALAGCFFFSPPFSGLLVLFLALLAAAARPAAVWRELSTRRIWWLVGGGILLASGVGMWSAWRSAAPEGITHPLALFWWWVRKSADLQALMSKQLSGWMQKIFASTPAWSHMPMLILYGVVQPFLPAAVFDLSGAWIWRLVAIWRALGWTLLLPLLLFAPFQLLVGPGVKHGGPRYGRRWSGMLIFIVWIVILIASFRSGGDLWDNPRYRAAFAGLQVMLGAWTAVTAVQQGSPWLRRVLVGAGLALLWFMPWYLRRYSGFVWPVESFFKTVSLGIISAVLYWVGDITRETSRTPK